MPSAADYIDDVRKYAGDVDDAALAGIVKHLGITLRNRDSSLVSGSDPVELGRIRDGFMTKKLALGLDAAAADAALAEIVAIMKEDRTKSRVTFYYLLAKKFDKLGLFGG